MYARTIILAASLLSGCGLAVSNQINGMNETQLASVNDGDLCNPNVATVAADNERAKRGLGDCSMAHRRCRSMGYEMGTPPYLQCRQVIGQEEMQQAALRQKMASDFMKAAQPPPLPPPPMPTTTRCNTWGNTTTCNSY